MTRDQIIAHLSLLGWVPIVSREGDNGPERNRVGSELRLLNPALRHNIPGGVVRLPHSKTPYYFRGWDSPAVDPYWATTDWRNAHTTFLTEALHLIEGACHG